MKLTTQSPSARRRNEHEKVVDGMSLRDIRKRWTPNWLTTDARRRRRNVLFRRLGIARCHTPPLLTRHPELYVRSWLPYVVAHELLANRELTSHADWRL